MKSFVSSAPGKLVLFGEYAVLEGASALVCAVDRRARIRYEASDSGTLTLDAKPLGLKDFILRRDGVAPDTSRADRRAGLVYAVLAELERTYPSMMAGLVGGKFEIDTTDMSLAHGGAKLGVGSSAAVAVALVGGIGLSLADQPMNESQIFEVAQRAHLAFQGGRGSGVDIAAASMGGVLSFHRMSEQGALTRLSRPWPQGLQWQVVGTGQSASTSEFLTALRSFKESKPNDFNTLMDQMCELATVVAEAEQGDWVGWTLRWCEFLEKLGKAIGASIMSEKHTYFRDIALKNGLGYKPSGAGGGDAGFFVIPEQRSLDEVRTLLTSQNIHMLPISLDPQGVHAECLDSPELQG